MTDGVEPVRLLFVGDDPGGLELVKSELQRAGLEARIDRVERREEVLAHLDAAKHDVVLVDYQLRSWRGTDVLSEASARGLDMPVILLTEALEEGFADECVRLGAADFVLKHRLSRLPLAVRRAQDEIRRRADHAAALDHIRTLSVAIDQGPAAVFITDTMGRIQYVNQRFSEITGYSSDEVLGQNPRLLKSGRTPLEVYEKLWGTVLRGETWRSEVLNRRKGGELYWSLVSISPMADSSGVVTHFVAVHQDISERRWAEEAIREREERLRQITENITEVFFVVSVDFSETLYISPAYEEVWGRSCRSAYEDPSSFMSGVHPDDRSILIGNITNARAGERPGRIDFRVIRPDGTERWVSAHAAPVLDKHGRVYRISGVALDITERRAAQARLRESEERFRKLAAASFDVIVVTADGAIREVNDGFERVLGYPPHEVVGRHPSEFVTESSRAEVLRRVDGHVEGRYELELVHRDGHPVLTEATARNHEIDGRPARITALRDLTKTRALERQLRQSQKLEAVARLAGGVAHDFNNLLTVIMTEVQLLRLGGQPPEAGALDAALDDIETSAKRAAALTRQLLTFSRRDVVEPEVLNPADVLDGLRKMLDRLIGEDVTVEMTVAPNLGTVRLDRGHLEQVIVNLAVNARDAMPDGGELRIELMDASLDESYAQSHADVRPGAYVLIAVSDTGHGMTDEVKARLFEPFFTTKPSGKGTGLGLATSYGIVRECGGHIGVYSEVGVGTTMKVYLPWAEEPGEAVRLEEEPKPDGPLAATILVVEDDEAVRSGAVRFLQSLGCHVLAAGNAGQALDVLRGLARPPDVVFTDVVMPDVSGPTLATRIREEHGDVKILFTTGYTGEMATRHKLVRDGVDVLTKPYTPADLEAKIRSVLQS